MAANTTTVVGTPQLIELQGTITRPNDATQYTAGDAISDNATTPTAAGYFSWNFASRMGGSVFITDALFHKSDTDLTTCSIGMMLFTTLPALAGFEDNGAIAITDAEMKECKGIIKWPDADWDTVITGDVCHVKPNIGLVLPAATTTVFGILFAIDAYTPSAQEILTVTLHAWVY